MSGRIVAGRRDPPASPTSRWGAEPRPRLTTTCERARRIWASTSWTTYYWAANNAVALADKLSDHGQSAMEDHDYLLHSFEAVWVDTAHETIRLYGEDDVRMPALGRPSRPGYTGALLRVGAHGDDVVFVTQSTFAGDAARVVVLLDPVNIWMPSEGTPYDKDFCVFTNTFVELYCTHDEGEIVRRAFLDASATDVVWDLDDSPQMASSWQLFLTGVFNSRAARTGCEPAAGRGDEFVCGFPARISARDRIGAGARRIAESARHSWQPGPAAAADARREGLRLRQFVASGRDRYEGRISIRCGRVQRDGRPPRPADRDVGGDVRHRSPDSNGQ